MFDITAGLDDHGAPVELSDEMIGGLIWCVIDHESSKVLPETELISLSVPRDVPCGLRPRSETAIRLILEAQTAEEL